MSGHFETRVKLPEVRYLPLFFLLLHLGWSVFPANCGKHEFNSFWNNFRGC